MVREWGQGDLLRNTHFHEHIYPFLREYNAINFARGTGSRLKFHDAIRAFSQVAGAHAEQPED